MSSGNGRRLTPPKKMVQEAPTLPTHLPAGPSRHDAIAAKITPI